MCINTILQHHLLVHISAYVVGDEKGDLYFIKRYVMKLSSVKLSNVEQMFEICQRSAAMHSFHLLLVKVQEYF